MKIKQTTQGLDKYITKYGCYFMSICYASGKEYKVDEINKAWDKCISLGYISGDLNNDGDKDDANEALIQDPDGVAKVVGAKLMYIDKHFPPETVIPEHWYSIGCYFNPTNKFRHFVVIDTVTKAVVYDPIPNSKTVANGYLESMRLFRQY